jgi:hypothetical protein
MKMLDKNEVDVRKYFSDMCSKYGKVVAIRVFKPQECVAVSFDTPEHALMARYDPGCGCEYKGEEGDWDISWGSGSWYIAGWLRRGQVAGCKESEEGYLKGTNAMLSGAKLPGR